MDNSFREEKNIGRFIRARREASAAATYSELPARRRHVQHLTQSDLADVINVSTVVISQIEQGRYPNLNHAILHRIARALRFTTQQEIYLFGLLETRPADQKSSEPAPVWVRTSISALEHPVVVVNPAYDTVCINDKARSLFGTRERDDALEQNAALSVFQSPEMREFIVDWQSYAASVVSGLKMSYAMFPEYRDHIDQLAGRLEVTDDLFRALWNQDDPLVKPSIEKQIQHRDVGQLNVLQILSDIVEAPTLARVEFIPADDETRRKFANL